tara:strand:+ start:261 stop:1169 length:909 start_codon:yes stop_codon:yes gene_type:complete
MRKNFIIEEDFSNSRLDRWFRKKICLIPQSLIEKNIRKGNIKVNNKKEKSSYKLKKNDQVSIFSINFIPRTNKQSLNVYKPSSKELVASSKIFIENNDNFVVINKPAGIAVQSGTKSRKNIIDILKKTKEFRGVSPYTVHRIDKETTGVLIVAKNRKYAQLFTSLFRIRKIHKTYLSIVVGEINNKKGTFIDEIVHYDDDKKVKLKAITHYKALDINNNYSLLELNPETGRKHQLRKQLLIHGHPILGDLKYRISKKYIKNSTLMLHAYKIKFSINNVKYTFMAELPPEFKETLKEKYLKIF